MTTLSLTSETDKDKVKLDSLLGNQKHSIGQKAFFLRYDKQSFREFQEQRGLVNSQIEEARIADAAKHSQE